MKVLVVTNMWPGPGAPSRGVFVAEQVGSLEARGHEVEVLAIDPRGRRRRYLELPPRLAVRALRFRPDVVHAHYGLTGAVAVTWRLAPVVVTFHGSDVFIPWQRRISRIAAAGAAASIFVSEAARAGLGVTGEVIPCGVDPARFRPVPRGPARRRLGISPGARVVLFAGRRDNPVKGFELLEAARARMARPVTVLELRDVPRDEVPEWMAAADVLALTSRHEGSPMVVKEALSCGLPVVSVPVGDVGERILGVPGCRLVEARPEAVAGGLDAVLDGGMRLESIPALAEVHLDAVAARVEGVYRRLAPGVR